MQTLVLPGSAHDPSVSPEAAPADNGPIIAGVLLHRLGLAAIVSAAAALTLYWVFLVPIFQAPDEPLNWDYALAIREHGRPFVVHHTSWDELPEMVHPYTDYLIEATRFRTVAMKSDGRMAPDYGTRAYYAELERNAPSRAGLRIDTPSKPFSVYPFGYYGLLATWIGILHWFHDGPVCTFFGARILSVLLLMVSLTCVDAIARQLKYKPWFALLLTAAVGFFPLTSFVASAVQMDNLSMTLVSVAFYLALRVRQEPASCKLVGLLGLILGALLLTKQHFFVCVFVPIAAMLATRLRGVGWSQRLKLAVLMVAPGALAGSLYLWTTWGTVSLYVPPATYAPNVVTYTLATLERAVRDFYLGKTHDSFWGVFGWLDAPLVVRGQNTTAAVKFLVQTFTWLMLGLTLLRLEQVVSRLVRLAWRGRTALALRLAFANPLVNSYFLFTVIMFFIYVLINNRFGAQGRNWWPMLLPIFLVGISYAPRALTLRWCQRALAALATAALLLYCAVGSYYSLSTLHNRYYVPLPQSQVAAPLLPSSPPDES